MKQVFFYLSIFLLFTSCIKNEPKPKALEADTEIAQKVKTLYATYGKSSDVIYNKPIPKDLFSPELEKTFQEAIDASKADIEKVKKSDHPTDKPLLMEGSIFTSLYEGYTTYKIKSVQLMGTKPVGMTADVTIDFENSQVSPKITWSDTVHLVNTLDSGWKVDNITFSEKFGGKNDLKSNLQSFISGAKK
ncbi:hypothetical protein [Chryseobacterium limigenitum]|uniref:DUF3828 domain-containing protein n=1 Tax=Chryseobacterium limigenitum TaxID=1612149 RepID=A0A1K2ICD7_9FLAO|nr:hypothetical protein [Chryseobacterium limigenitum]SFZ89944.1 hypothetical protein SAMN05216324_101140 [Chryseobacterium limigenitum]